MLASYRFMHKSYHCQPTYQTYIQPLSPSDTKAATCADTSATSAGRGEPRGPTAETKSITISEETVNHMIDNIGLG